MICSTLWPSMMICHTLLNNFDITTNLTDVTLTTWLHDLTNFERPYWKTLYYLNCILLRLSVRLVETFARTRSRIPAEINNMDIRKRTRKIIMKWIQDTYICKAQSSHERISGSKDTSGRSEGSRSNLILLNKSCEWVARQHDFQDFTSGDLRYRHGTGVTIYTCVYILFASNIA